MRIKNRSRRLSLILLVSFLFSILAVSLGNFSPSLSVKEIEIETSVLERDLSYDWVTMHYIDGDNDLEEMAIDDINEMEAGHSVSSVVHLVLIDRNTGYDTSNGDWTGTRLYQITSDSTSTITSTLLNNYGELNMGNHETLQTFIEYGLSNYVSTHYWLNIWDHGGGIDGMCWDDTNGSDSLTVNETQDAIAAAEASTFESLDVISIDACFMNMIEVAYEYKDLADYFVSSEESVPGDGFDYESIFAGLEATPSMNGSVLSELLVSTYDTFYDPLYGDVTLSALDLAIMENLTKATNYFAGNLSAVLSAGAGNAIDNAFFDTLTFYDEFIIDYQHFVENIQSNTTLMGLYPLLDTAATDLLAELDNLIIANFQGSAYSGNANGVTIFLAYDYASYGPYITKYVDGTGEYAAIDWLADTQWDEFADQFYTLGFGEVGSSYTPLTLGNAISSQSISEDASDYYSIEITTASAYEFRLTVQSGDIDLYIYDASMTTLLGYSQFWNPDDGSSEKARIFLFPGIYTVEVYGFYAGVYSLFADEDAPIEITLDEIQTGSGGTQEGEDEHYSQIYSYYYLITLDAGDYDLELTYNSLDVDYDLYVFTTGYVLVDSSDETGNLDEVTLYVGENTTYLIEVYGYSGYGSFSFKAKIADGTGTGPGGFIPGFTAIISIFSLLALSSVALVITKQQNRKL